MIVTDPRSSTAWRVAVALALLLAVAAAAGAQVRDPLTGLVADVRVLTASLPSSGGWTPVLETGTLVPSRGFGGGADLHLFVGRGRYRRLGLGVTGVVAQGRTTDATHGATVTTRLFTAGPSVSANFGHRLGWSYLSAGPALAKVSSFDQGSRDSAGAGMAYHYGFGARWFLNDRVGVSLDLRFWALTPRGATGGRPNAPATTRVVFGVGAALH